MLAKAAMVSIPLAFVSSLEKIMINNFTVVKHLSEQSFISVSLSVVGPSLSLVRRFELAT